MQEAGQNNGQNDPGMLFKEFVVHPFYANI